MVHSEWIETDFFVGLGHFGEREKGCLGSTSKKTAVSTDDAWTPKNMKSHTGCG